jgi:DNA-binding CsgD family transcriptional regulator
MSKTTMKRHSSTRGSGRSNGSPSGSLVVSLSAIEKVLGLSVGAARERYARLTERERQVAGMMAGGKRNRQIAEELVISPKTLDIHRANAMHKLEAETTARLANLVNLLRLADIAGA